MTHCVHATAPLGAPAVPASAAAGGAEGEVLATAAAQAGPSRGAGTSDGAGLDVQL